MNDIPESKGPYLKLAKVLKSGSATSKDAKRLLSDLGLLAIGYCLTITKEIASSKEITKEDIDSIFQTLRGNQ